MDPTLLIGDIVERDSSARKPVEFPAPPTSSTGFPQHKRRWKTSAFKQQRASTLSSEASISGSRRNAEASELSGQSVQQPQSFEEAEKKRIDYENQQKISSMSPQEIAQAQDDIMSGLNPALIKRLLQRANIDEQNGLSPFDLPAPEKQEKAAPSPEIKVEDASSPPPAQPTPNAKATGTATTSSKNIATDYDENKAPAQIPPDLFPISDLPKSTHFPVPPGLPDLDASDPNFLATLHDKYFPSLPADPSKLAWMAPVPSKDSPADKMSPYYPHPEIGVAALRFDFRGRFLSPRVSRSIPSTKGLHHHGEAPEAAGYTIAELARLAKSSVPAQRCMAYQTLGRILYRLGQGEWGKTENDPIATGVWSSVKQGRVLESLMEAASGEGGHRGSRAYATEALWLFEKGGWKETFKGR
ncbi:RNA polymerase II-associated protein RBA50 [Tolypocladium ophioglossoides CBS 100239]|uniref:RNA polymerase II-associated protein RBA50 n=1 Tax=Tolypocladium ophioglossoides (strain CBS 100239) TaxID=1163406 RepID=A0A0L0NGA8_TOLOC|nr:RNA polymerase II-associated protein RBA50 [Tolypocladium ophioglossoides CBS 100239]